MIPGGPPPVGKKPNERLKEQKPKSIREVPSYIARVTAKFFRRLLYIYRIVWETGPWILFVMVFMAVLQGILPILSAFVGSRILNGLAEAYPAVSAVAASIPGTVMTFLIMSFVISFVQSVASRINNTVMNISGELVANNVNLKIMNKAREVDVASFDRPEFYEKLENASREAGHRPLTILRSNFSIVSTLISMTSFVAVLWAISPAAPFIVVLVSVPSAVINFVYRKKNVIYLRFHSKDRRKMSYYSSLLTDKDMVKELRIFGLYDSFIDRYKEVYGKYFAGLKRIYIGEGLLHVALTFLTSAVNCFLFIFIARGVYAGEYRVGDYSLYTGALMSISAGITTLISTMAGIYEGTLFIDNMIEFMDEKPTLTPVLSQPRKPERHRGHCIELRGVSFRYPGTRRDVIKNVDLTIEEGQTVVLVGLNGAGKTTLIKLLTRLYDPTEGVILLDGHDIREYDVGELYKLYGIIFQDFGRYAASVDENIEFGNIFSQKDTDRIHRAAEESSADAFIEALPRGYDTPLTRWFEEDGIEPSVGQWQKIAVARAFYSDTDIMILDEPTASLDAIAEKQIFDQFDALRHGKTTIFVSHRLSSATVADKIVVLMNGEIAEQGTHRELMEKKGHYCELFTAQARRYIGEDEDGEGAPVPVAPAATATNIGNTAPPPRSFGNGPMPPPASEKGMPPPASEKGMPPAAEEQSRDMRKKGKASHRS